MPVNMGKAEEGPGLGCSCLAFRLDEPTPEQALRALARSANVTVEPVGVQPDGTYRCDAWTEPGTRYVVIWDPHRPGGWCKHIIASLVQFVPWHRQLALGADWALEEIERLTREIKRLEKEIKKRDREIGKLRG